ncbi:MAG: hypothetical protein HY855_03950 [Burkholderiales bacterium]|nr:hypothetical protein [Burkholderiales bacterium]
MNLFRLFVVSMLLALAGCANVAKVSTGEVTVEDRIVMTLGAAWNQVNLPNRRKPVLWTQDGITVDALEWWIGVRDGDNLVEVAKDKRPLTFRASMEPHELASLFEGVYGKDGSTFKLDRLAPTDFLGGKGYRLDGSVVRKADDVRVAGVAWFTVRNGELFAMTFTAPRLGFFPRHQGKVEQVARSARPKA